MKKATGKIILAIALAMLQAATTHASSFSWEMDRIPAGYLLGTARKFEIDRTLHEVRLPKRHTTESAFKVSNTGVAVSDRYYMRGISRRFFVKPQANYSWNSVTGLMQTCTTGVTFCPSNLSSFFYMQIKAELALGWSF